MARLHVIAEGQSEETFIKRVLAPHLWNFDVWPDVTLVTTSRKKRKKGGVTTYGKLRNDLNRRIRQHRGSEDRFTTMLDLYALPKDFPGKEVVRQGTEPYDRVRTLERHFREDIGDRRFIPYLQLHEFEALVLVDPGRLTAQFEDCETAVAELTEFVRGFDSPELIGDDPDSAPSKRISRLIPEYRHRKRSAGPLITMEVGLPRLREKCPHFNSWIETLESIGKAG